MSVARHRAGLVEELKGLAPSPWGKGTHENSLSLTSDKGRKRFIGVRV